MCWEKRTGLVAQLDRLRTQIEVVSSDWLYFDWSTVRHFTTNLSSLIFMCSVKCFIKLEVFSPLYEIVVLHLLHVLSFFVLVKSYFRAFYFRHDGCSWAAGQQKRGKCSETFLTTRRWAYCCVTEMRHPKCSHLVRVEPTTLSPVPLGSWFPTLVSIKYQLSHTLTMDVSIKYQLSHTLRWKKFWAKSVASSGVFNVCSSRPIHNKASMPFLLFANGRHGHHIFSSLGRSQRWRIIGGKCSVH